MANEIMSIEGQLCGIPLAGPESFSQQQLDYLKRALGVDETVLWEGSLALNNDTGTLSEAIENFQSVAIYAQSVYGGGFRKFVYTINGQAPQYRFSTDSLDGASIYQVFFNLNITGAQVTVSRSKKVTIQYSNNSITCADQTSPSNIISYVTKIVGIHRIAGGN